ncbi:MAG TPA: DinB family protein [Bryobacteraceae bacterium]|nr:DinB family protein [Bryobacteraceae bacterium]
MKTIGLLICLSLSGAVMHAQSTADPLSAGIKGIYNIAKNNVARAAEKMPEENYAFKPTPDVRSFGQIVGHVADAQYMFCSAATGEKNPAPGIEKSKTTKADLVKALSDAFAYCDKAYDGMTDAHAAEIVKFFGRDQTKLTILAFNSAHDMEHYGNLVTYMRIKGLVPPSSEQRK